MDSTLPAQTGNAAPLRGLAALPVRQLLVLVLGMAALAAVLAASVLYSRDSDYRVLFANLEDRDGGSVVAALTQLNVPYRFAAGGGAILVPGERVHDVRLKLAAQGLPQGGSIGFELIDQQKFGVTQFQERLNFQRALEGELARSIKSLAAVQSARVHLAIPNGSAFVRKRQPPSASVLLNLRGARALDENQVAGIVNLVAASVPELTASQVSVVDQNGMLLSRQTPSADGLDSSQLSYTRQLESGYMQRIVDILEPIVGKGNVRAQVTADVDFTRQESTSELFKPNQGSEPATVRSQQMTIDQQAADAANGGVAGALSNQPAAAARAPVNGPGQVPGVGGVDGSALGSGRRASVTNFEVDKTIRVTRSASGSVRRIAAAVLINHRRSVDAQGKATQTPLSAAELESVNALVREAVGFTEARGDSISVLNTPFNQEEIPPLPETPMWKDPSFVATGKEVGKHIGLVLLGLMTIFMVIKPALKALRAAAPAASGQSGQGSGRIAQVVGDEMSLPAPDGSGQRQTARIDPNEDVLKLARENPATVANVIRNWVDNEA